MKQLGPCWVRAADAADRERIWLWRNHASIRAVMFNAEEISWDEHVLWFERILSDKRMHALVFENQDSPAGFVNLHEFPCGMVAEWGFYKAPDSPGGVGIMLGTATLRYAFEVLKLHKIYAQVLAFNHRSINLHIALGFEQEGMLKDQYFDGRAYHDVCCFGIRRAAWENALPSTGLNI